MRTSKFALLSLLIVALAILPGCRDRIYLENVTMLLMAGVDLDRDNNLMFYMSSPVFSKEAKDKNEETKVQAISLRNSRGKFEARLTALVSSGKIQNLLIGRSVLQHEDWFKLFDVMIRDSKTRANARVIAVDGSVENVMFFSPKNKRRLSLHIAKLIDTTHERNLVQETSIFALHRQFFEKGMTPFLPEIRLNDEKSEVVVTGTALTNKKGKYLTTISLEENQLLQMLQDEIKGELSLTLVLPEEKKEGSLFDQGVISFYVTELKRKVKISHTQGKFRFDIQLNMPILLTERLFQYDVENEADKLEQMIDRELEKQIHGLIKNFQELKIDPIGLGLYARAYQYKEWKEVQNDWGKAFSSAEVNIRVRTSIKNMGETK